MTRQRQSHPECLETLEMMKSNYHRAYNEFVKYSKNCIGLKFNKLVNELHKRSYDRIIKGLFKLNCYILKNKLSKSKKTLKTKIEKKNVQEIIVEEEKLKNVQEIVVEEEKLKNVQEIVVEEEKLKNVQEIVVEEEKEVKSNMTDISVVLETKVEKDLKKYKRILGKICRKCKMIDCVEKNYGMCENCRQIK